MSQKPSSKKTRDRTTDKEQHREKPSSKRRDKDREESVSKEGGKVSQDGGLETDENPALDRRATDKKKDLKDTNVEQQPWYHGMRSRDDALAILKARGDWLMRATESRNMTELVISVLDENSNCKNFTLKYSDEKWYLGCLATRKHRKLFKTAVELVNYYKSHGLPGNVAMKRCIYKEQWMVSHEVIDFKIPKDLIGSGNFCDVYKGTFIKDGAPTPVAVKVCHKSDTTETDGNNEGAKEAMTALLREAYIMSYYKHDHVIQFYGLACNHKPFMVVMEYCPGGGLDNHLKKQKENIGIGERVLYCYEAAKGMNYLHHQGCTHRDLAARNCLISNEGKIKIADFGLSDMVNFHQKTLLKQQVPLRWLPPECLVKEPIYSRKSDVWAYGVLIYEIFNLGERPWPNEEYRRIATWIRRCQMMEMPKITPPEIKDLVSRIWQKDPERRPDFKKMVADLFDLHHNTYKAPAPELCSVNLLKNGIVRAPFDTVADETQTVVDAVRTRELDNFDDETVQLTVSKPTSKESSTRTGVENDEVDSKAPCPTQPSPSQPPPQPSPSQPPPVQIASNQPPPQIAPIQPPPTRPPPKLNASLIKPPLVTGSKEAPAPTASAEKAQPHSSAEGSGAPKDRQGSTKSTPKKAPSALNNKNKAQMSSGNAATNQAEENGKKKTKSAGLSTKKENKKPLQKSVSKPIITKNHK